MVGKGKKENRLRRGKNPYCNWSGGWHENAGFGKRKRI